jgi:hypothetical protein
MAQIWPLVSDSSLVGGVLAHFPSGKTLTASWVRRAPVIDTLTAAKDTTAKLLQQLIDEGAVDDADRTNWASFTAAVQRVISDWNDKRRNALYAEGAEVSNNRANTPENSGLSPELTPQDDDA